MARQNNQPTNQPRNQMPTTTNRRPGRPAKALPARPGCRVVTPSPLAVTTARGSMTKQPRLSLLGPRVTMASQRLEPRPKQVDQYYREWRTAMCRRAGWQCEAIEDGRRCEKPAMNGDRLFADTSTNGGTTGLTWALVAVCAGATTPRRRYANAQEGWEIRCGRVGWMGWGFKAPSKWGAESAWGILL
jgi:hypothetical protein